EQPRRRGGAAGDRETQHGDVVTARTAGAVFAREWAERAPLEEVRKVLEGFPILPQQLDIQLLLAAEEDLGSLRGRPDLKSELRGTFWFALKEAARGRERLEAGDDP